MTVEQVLRFYYDKRQRLPQCEEVLDTQGEDTQSLKKQVLSSRKRMRSSREGLSMTITEDNHSIKKKLIRSSDADCQFTEEQNIPSASLRAHDDFLVNPPNENFGEEREKPEFSNEREHHSLIHDCTLSKMKSNRNKKFNWTEKAKRAAESC